MDACGHGVFWKIFWKILMISWKLSWKLSSGDDDGHVRGGDRDRGGDHGHLPKKTQHIG